MRFSLLVGFTLGCLTLSASIAMAAAPMVQFHRPLGVIRGEESTVTFHGDRLGDAHTAICDLPGIEILEVKPVNEKSATIKLIASKELAPGLYPVRLVTKSGIANLRLVGVGTMPIVNEKEPNNSFDSPQVIPMNCTVEGVVDREDVDHYQVELKAGEKLTVEVEGIRYGYSLNNQFVLDPYIAILDENRFEVAVSDDSSLLLQDGLCTFTPDKPGKYTILMRESAFGGHPTNNGYRLHIGSFPRPVTVSPAAGTTGDVLQADVIDVDGSVSQASIQLPSGPVDQWPVVTETPAGIAPSPNWIRVGESPIVLDAEPNDDYKKGQPCQVPAMLCGVLRTPGDFDCYRFPCRKGEKFRVEVVARQVLRSPLDAVTNVFDPAGKTVKSADDAGFNPDGTVIDFTAETDGEYTIRVYDHLRMGSDRHNYVIVVNRLEPTLKLSLKELTRSEAYTVSVPQGGYGAAVVQVTRDQFNEDVALAVEDLPAGVTATTFPIPKSRGEIPVLFQATADAPIAASLFEMRGTAKIGDKTVEGELFQSHNLVLGQNRRPMFVYQTDRSAIAVTDPMPFDLELIQPKTPLLQRGSKELVIKINRHEGFKNSVYPRTFYTPPGVSVNNGMQIKPDASEIRIPMTANGSAAIGSWPLMMRVVYATDRGSAAASTAAINLNIEAPVFNFTFPRSAGEIGSATNLTVGLAKVRDIEGDMTVTLVGLPNGVTCAEATQPVKLDATAVTFPLTITDAAKPGVHKTLVIQTKIVRDGETMMQTDGTGELRIDKPLPPKANAPAKPVAAKPKTPAPAKPLSRLEQLRQQKDAP